MLKYLLNRNALGPTAQGYVWLGLPCFVRHEKSVFSSLKEIGKILATCQEVLQLFNKGLIALTFCHSSNECQT